MIFENGKISVRQAQVLFISEVFATAVVFLPQGLWKISGGAGAFAVFPAVAVLFLVLWLICLSYKDGCGDFGKMLEDSLGKSGAVLVLALFWFKLVLLSSLWLKEFSLIIRDTMLPESHYQLIAAVILTGCFYLTQKDFETRGRTAEIFIIIMTLLFLPVLFLVSLTGDYTNLLPVGGFDFKSAIKGSAFAFSTLGSADYFWFLCPKTKGKRGGIFIGAAVVGIMLFLTVAVVFSTFGDTVADKSRAVLKMMDTVDFPGAFIERQDVLMIGFWILSFFVYISGGMTYGNYILERLTARESHIVTGIAIYALSVSPLSKVLSVEKAMLLTTPIFLICLPALLLVCRAKRRREKCIL